MFDVDTPSNSYGVAYSLTWSSFSNKQIEAAFIEIISEKYV